MTTNTTSTTNTTTTTVSTPVVTATPVRFPGQNVLERLRETRREAFIKLTRMHLLFYIDCPGDSLSVLFQDESNADSESQLNEGMIRRMNKLIEFIGQEQNIVEEGIFRRCGSLARQQELKTKLLQELPVELDSGQYNVHDCANVLKTLLSDLPEPLLSEIFFKINCQISETSKDENQEPTPMEQTKQIKKLQVLLILLPKDVRNFVQNLLNLLKKASLHSKSNKMDARNFATLFAPHLLFPRTLKATEMQQHRIILTDELQFMIENVETIFNPPRELMLDAEKELQKPIENKGDDDDVVDTVLTFCNRDNQPHESETAKQLAELYAYVISMPDTPQRKNLIKTFNRQNGGITPLSLKKGDGSAKDKANFLKSVKKSFQKGLDFLHSTRSTPTKANISKCNSPSDTREPAKLESWSSPHSKREQEYALGALSPNKDSKTLNKLNILPSKDSKKPKV
ncbi:rho GTPase activating protein at 54D [Brevipalpus obovatus]|uniref:rho GTPase activating protein at 54D n=1 Tax=Brevipalpus obovatus TaxID=246614 RepID=UPI003D9EC779